MARCRLERFGEGRIYPHEETLSGPKADRLLLTKACKANLSQIFGLYPDPQARRAALSLLDRSSRRPDGTFEATDHLGVLHRMWPVTDAKQIAEVAAVLSPQPIFIADGHHRYETACNYRDELAAANGGPLPPNHPANFVLMMFISMGDPGLIVMPTHRLFRGLPKLSSGVNLIQKARPAFHHTHRRRRLPILARIVSGSEIEASGDQGAIGLFTRRPTSVGLLPD